MNYTEAVALAKTGDERGFGYLYEHTYRSKYYLALQYMKNEEAAQDVLQESYLKAFAKLDTLEQPEAFPGWLGRIVANTAKNMLVKKNPLLFSDVAADEEEENFEDQIEDERIDNQPELSYSRQETQEMVHELIDSLSEEQRICILMFHIEGASISQIASALGCSENTVKSRLNYGRKNLKAKAEQLEKKGYKLYGLAPIPLLRYLLRTQQEIFSADGFFSKVGKNVAERVFDQSAGANHAVQSSVTQKAVEVGKITTVKAARAGFIHMVAGKIAVAILGVCFVGGAAVYGVSQLSDHQSQKENPPQNSQQTEEQEIQTGKTQKELKDSDYASLISGNLTKEELEYLLAYGPQEIPSEGFEETDYRTILNQICDASSKNGNLIQDYGTDENWKSQYSLEDVNRFFSAFSDYQLTEENDEDTENGIDVTENKSSFFPASLSYTATAEITSAEYTDTEMNVFYTYHFVGGDRGEKQETLSKKAVLEPVESGLYRIVKIETLGENTQTTSQTDDLAQQNGQGMKEIYSQVLHAVQNQESGYEFSDIDNLTGKYQYFLCDMDGDGIQELIVGAEYQDRMGTITANACHVYSCEKKADGFELKKINGNFIALDLYIASDGNGLYNQEFSGGTGKISIYRITMQNDTVQTATEAEYEFMMGDDAFEQFRTANTSPEWTDISNESGLETID